MVHFAGHGVADESGGALVFEAEDGGADLVPAEAFAEMLAEPTINLAVLNACQTASAGALFQGVAQATLKRGVPAAVGMQVPILDRAAVQFAQEFYGAWSAGQPIESALAYARRLVSEETRGAAADWGIPVLFMGPIEGLTLELAQKTREASAWVRFPKRAMVLFLSLLGTVGLLLTIPDINKQLRTEVPVIQCVFPYPMESGYRFNVVVARFTVVDEDGRAAWLSQDSQRVADYFYQQLQYSFDELNLGLSYDIRPPAHTCPIPGRTREEREQAAAKLAEQIHAHVVVYGVIVDKGERSEFSPEFYVNHKGFEEADEVTGQYKLGRALTVALPFDSDQALPVDNPPLAARTNALSLMTIGLAYYSIDNYVEAMDYFSRAESIDGWLPTAGKEVIYLLLGSASNRRASRESSTAYLADALGYFDRALSIEPNYARAVVGKAGVMYLMAIGDPTDQQFDTIDLDMLNESEAQYQAALRIENSPETANIEARVHYGLGQVNIGRVVQALGAGGDWAALAAQSKAEYEAVVQAYESGNERIKNLAGHAYERLGLLAWLQEDYDTAVEQYRRSIELVSPYYQAYYSTWLGEVCLDACKIEPALQSYGEAIRIAESYGEAEQVDEYTQKLNELRSNPPQCN